ncbi:MAG: hypothetical protein JNM55_20065 [Anaerolineales bacterium]|nr:hypothetical protein [Anaerolineales bacterium]
MSKKSYEWTAFKKIIAATAIFIVFFCGIIVVLILSSRRANLNAEQDPPVKFSYCEAEPKELCILSFERGGPQNSFINFFVADRKFQDFYLIVKTEGRENRYECASNLKVRTNVVCSGAPLSLKQTIEINIFSSENNHLIGTGVFFIEAFLVSASEAQPTATAAIEPTFTDEPTETPTPEILTPEGTATETPSIESTQTAEPD